MTRPYDLTLMAFLGMGPVQQVLKKGVFGGPYLHFADLVNVSGFLYQSGALLARAKLDRLATLAELFAKPGSENDAINWAQTTAKARLNDYIDSFEEQPNSFTTMVYYTEYKKVGILIPLIGMANINTRTNQIKKVAFTKMPLKGVGPQIKKSMLEGIGFGSSFPELTEKMYRSNEEIDLDEWSQARKFGLNIPEKPEIITLEEQEEILLSMVAAYTQEYFPHLVAPLGLTEMLTNS